MVIRFLYFVLFLLGFITAHGASAIILNGTMSEIDTIQFVYQFPSAQGKGKGVIFVAHGCGDSAGTFWPKRENCHACHGKPLSQALVLEGLKRDYIVLAGTSGNKNCWRDSDHPRLVKLFHHFYTKILKDTSYKLPLFILGNCNGGLNMGYFLQNSDAMKLMQPINITALAVTITPIKLNPTYTITNKFPIPTLFVAMKKDGGVYWDIKKSFHLFRSARLEIAEPEPLTKEYFLQRGMGLFNEQESELLYQSFKTQGFLDEMNYLKQDPISFNHLWRQVYTTSTINCSKC